MKTITALLALSAAIAAPAHAQLFRPEAVNGAILGGIAGAVIGNNSGELRHSGSRGATIGAIAGAVIGSAVADTHDESATRTVHTPMRNSHDRGYADRGVYFAPSWDVSYGYGYDHGSRYSRYSRHGYDGWDVRVASPAYRVYRAPSQSYGYARPDNSSYASRGTILGGIAGAIIGHNSGDLRHNGWRGAAIGAGAGWLLGSIADQRASEIEAARAYSSASDADDSPDRTPTPATTPAPAAPQNVTIINNYYGSTSASPMAGANQLFGR